MTVASIIFALAALAFGLVAAWYWYESSQVELRPTWDTEPGDALLSQMGWMAGAMTAMTESARLNKLAALWTAGSVVLGAASIIVGSLFS
jgi:hypothetical protein